jgi:hypothetical protein
MPAYLQYPAQGIFVDGKQDPGIFYTFLVLNLQAFKKINYEYRSG